jgi:hypothetical protein
MDQMKGSVMKRTLLSLFVALLLPSTSFAQVAGFSGNYTADLTCVGVSNAQIDGVLASQAPYLERGTTVTASGTHPVCALSLRYDQIVFGGVPTGAGPLEVAHIILDLKPKSTFTCPNTVGAPLMSPSTKVSFIPLMHQNDANFVMQSRAAFGYNAHMGNILRNHSVGSTQWTAAPVTPGQLLIVPFIPLPIPDASNQLNFQATFHTRVSITNAANLAYLSAALDAPVFGNVATGPAWNVVTWNASTNTTSQNGVVNWSSSVLPGGYVTSNHSGLNASPLGGIHFDSSG